MHPLRSFRSPESSLPHPPQPATYLTPQAVSSQSGRNFKPLQVLTMPSPSRMEPERPESLDDDFLDELEAIERLPARVSRPLPRFVPLQPEMFANARDPWGIHSILDPFRLCLPEISVTTALVAGCGLLAGTLLAPFMNGIAPLWIFGFYLTAHIINLGSLYLDAKGGPSSRLKGRLRTLTLGLFLFTLPHAVAFGLLGVSR